MDKAVEVPPKKPVPETDRDFGRYLSSIGQLLRREDRIVETARKRIDAIQKRRDERINKLREEGTAFVDAAYTYAKDNRERFTRNGERSSSAHVGGVVSWREAPYSVSIEEAQVDNVMKEIKRRRLAERYIRIKEELDKEALGKDRLLLEKKPITGVSFVRRLLFYIKPSATESYWARDIHSGRWDVARPPKKKI
jgi:phage host-nuclease inhibitor protein Gam